MQYGELFNLADWFNDFVTVVADAKDRKHHAKLSRSRGSEAHVEEDDEEGGEDGDAGEKDKTASGEDREVPELHVERRGRKRKGPGKGVRRESPKTKQKSKVVSAAQVRGSRDYITKH